MKRYSIRAASLMFTAMLIVGAIGGHAFAQEKSATSSEAESIQKIVRDYLLKYPEIVIEAIEAYKRKQTDKELAAIRRTIAARKDELYYDRDSAIGGNLKGDVTLVEFFDYRCGVCKRIHPVVAELLKRDGKIRRVFKEWPILGRQSVFASRAAIASRRQGDVKYLAFHNAMMENKRTLSRTTVLGIASSVGLDPKRLERDMAAPEVGRIIQRNNALASALKLNGTPSFVIGDTLLRGGRDLDTLLAIVKRARKKGS